MPGSWLLPCWALELGPAVGNTLICLEVPDNSFQECLLELGCLRWTQKLGHQTHTQAVLFRSRGDPVRSLSVADSAPLCRGWHYFWLRTRSAL